MILATYDPGWNDPPPMPTANATINSNRPKLSLNKRVAFPMQGGVSSTSSNVKTTAEGLPLPISTAKYQPPPMLPNEMNTIPSSQPPSVLPPPPIGISQSVQPPLLTTINQMPTVSQNQPILLPPQSTPVSASTSENIPLANQDLPSDLSSNEMHVFCQKAFATLAEKMAATEEPSKLHEIQKRLDIFNKMWTENKFTTLVQQKLYDIAKG